MDWKLIFKWYILISFFILYICHFILAAISLDHNLNNNCSRVKSILWFMFQVLMPGVYEITFVIHVIKEHIYRMNHPIPEYHTMFINADNMDEAFAKIKEEIEKSKEDHNDVDSDKDE